MGTPETNEFKLQTVESKRQVVRGLLDQCTEKQKLFFNRLWGSIDSLKEEKMEIAYWQCKRTLAKNLQKGRPPIFDRLTGDIKWLPNA